MVYRRDFTSAAQSAYTDQPIDQQARSGSIVRVRPDFARDKGIDPDTEFYVYAAFFRIRPHRLVVRVRRCDRAASPLDADVYRATAFVVVRQTKPYEPRKGGYVR
jgi:hypothetical protein